MADNYLERRHEAYLAQKAAKEEARKAAFRCQLKAYKARLAAAKAAQQAGEETAKEAGDVK